MITNREIRPGDSFWYVDLVNYDVKEGLYDPYRNPSKHASSFYPKDENIPYSIPKHICYRYQEDALDKLKAEILKEMGKVVTKIKDLELHSLKIKQAYFKNFKKNL